MEQGPRMEMGGEQTKNNANLATRELKEMQKQADALIEELPQLDFDNQRAILEWLKKFQAPSNYVGVKRNVNIIIKIFKEKGYKINTNVSEKFNAESRDNYGRFIVVQALMMLKKEGYIPDIIFREVEKWERELKT